MGPSSSSDSLGHSARTFLLEPGPRQFTPHTHTPRSAPALPVALHPALRPFRASAPSGPGCSARPWSRRQRGQVSPHWWGRAQAPPPMAAMPQPPWEASRPGRVGRGQEAPCGLPGRSAGQGSAPELGGELREGAESGSAGRQRGPGIRWLSRWVGTAGSAWAPGMWRCTREARDPTPRGHGHGVPSAWAPAPAVRRPRLCSPDRVVSPARAPPGHGRRGFSAGTKPLCCRSPRWLRAARLLRRPWPGLAARLRKPSSRGSER